MGKILARVASILLLLVIPCFAEQFSVSGRVLDPHGQSISGATVQLRSLAGGRMRQRNTGSGGQFQFTVTSRGSFSLTVEATTFEPFAKSIEVGSPDSTLEIQLQPRQNVLQTVEVTADVNTLDIVSPDPEEKVFVRQDLLDANPGRPGAPVSIPGYPIETASGGIKAPQYFAPGVAGDHGEPIAQYIAAGTYLVLNNLSANAHGNGYADPNIFIPEILESVEVDGGAYNVRQGNHALNLAATYGLRSHIDPFVTLTGDSRDLDLAAGLSPTLHSFVAIEASYGNGFLKRLEHRQQYKLNGQRIFKLGKHELTLLGIGYYGSSYVAGLVPIFPTNENDINFPNLGDTIDPRQKDQTHTALIALNDTWLLTSSQEIEISGFFRTYNLALFSDFGQGLIRQSEFRTVAGQSTNYVNRLADDFSLMAGLDYEREAPRRDNLDHYGLYVQGQSSDGPFSKVDSNNVTISSVAPYIAGAGELGHYIRYYGGWRRDQIDFDNEDLLHPANSFQKWVGVNSPKATLSFLPKASWFLPLISGSFGEAFFTEDPRIGTGSTPGTPVATAHSYQLVLSRSIEKVDVKVTLGHVTTSQELGKIDPDTGLQQDQGPGRLKFFTAAVRRNFSQGSILATISKADARDVNSGQPSPEAPRTIFDLLGNVQKLPFHLEGRGEFEFVGRKPLGTGCEPYPDKQCVGTSVQEVRGALVRPFLNGRLHVGLNLMVAHGFSGQTTENSYSSEIPEVVGVRIPSYASANFTYIFGRHTIP